MSTRKYLRGGLLLTGSSVVAAACAFVRNVIVARLISLEDYGIASTFALTLALIEMTSTLAIDRLIVQARDGGTPGLIATGHAFRIVRGAIATLVQFAVARPIAELFGVPEVAWAFQVISLVPLIRSFGHLDVAVQQRDMRFGALAWIETGPQLLTAVLAVPLALWLADYRVMLALILVQVTAGAVLSHLVAEQPYRLAWNRGQVLRMVTFGWPLLVNGLLMFAIFQGDKALVGATRGMADLAWYGAAFSLALVPSLLAVKVIAPFMMPLLACMRDDRPAFERRSVLTVQLCTIAGVLVGLLLVLAGPALLIVVFGRRYAEGAAVIGWFGIMQGARIAKSGPAIVAMAAGDTKNPLLANLVRCTGIGLAAIAVALGEGVVAIAVCGMVGEVLGALTAILLLRRRPGVRVASMLTCAAASATVLAGAQWAALRWFQAAAPATEIAAGVAISAVLCAAVGAAFPQVLGLMRRVTADARAGRVWVETAPPAA